MRDGMVIDKYLPDIFIYRIYCIKNSDIKKWKTEECTQKSLGFWEQ